MNMRRFLLLLSVLGAYLTLNAESVSKSDALKKAQSFMPGRHFVESKSVASARAQESGKPEAFYVFNADNNGGFVVVSGDDRTTEILGYSKTGYLNMEQIPENLKWWLDGYIRQIEALGTSAKPAPKAKSRGAGSWDAIEPLIQTKWNQYYPYNKMCPDYKGYDWRDASFDTEHLITKNVDYHCVTGCVATAMAQIMYYYHYPNNCPAISEYKTSKGWTMKALDAMTFSWDQMKETYNGNETDASAESVAKLFRYCGQAVNMDYGLYRDGGSSASLSANVMAEVFGYSKNIHNLYRNLYTTSQWEKMIYAELAAKRPVLYSGQSENGSGHEFIVDGYDGKGLFHMNWGWGGMSDDYFVLSLADPYDQGAGGSDGAFQFDQSALIGVQPPIEDEVLTPQIESRVEPMTQKYTRASADEDFMGVHFNGTVFARYNFPSTEELNLQVGWALCQNGQIKHVVSVDSYSFDVGETYYGNGTDSEVTFGAGMALGRYEICQVYRYTEDAAWSLCSPYYYTYFYWAEVTATTLNVHEAISSFKINSITTSDYPAVGTSMDVTANVTNDGESFEQVFRLWAQKQGESSWSYVAKATRRIDPGTSDDVVMSYKPTAAGTYTLKVTNSTSTDALMTATVTVYASIKTTINNVNYLCNAGSKKAVVIGYTYSSSAAFNPVIPATFKYDDKQYTVTEIADNAFYQCFKLASLSIPTTVESIGDYAVYNCYRLSEIEIPEGVTHIGENAFKYCHALKAVSLPSTLQSIGNEAFAYNEDLETVVTAMTTPCTIDWSVFVNEKEVNGETVETFTSADLYVPIGRKTVYESADVWKEFSTIYQGEVKDITIEGITYTYVTGESFAIVKSGDETVLENKDVVIPSTIQAEGKTYKIKKIANGAFFQVFMKSLTFQPGLEEIGEDAFWNVYTIKEVIIPSGVKHIGAGAFQYCYWVKTVELPASLTSIGEYAFGDLKSLISVVSHISNPFAISENVFGLEDGDKVSISPATLSVPNGTKTKYEAISGWNMFSAIKEMDASKPGDVDGDGDVDVDDINTVVQYIFAGEYIEKADVNNDGKVDAADIVEIVKVIKKK